MIPLLILAAGGSRRMRGVDKLMQPIGNVMLMRDRAQVAIATGQPVFVTVPSLDHPRVDTLRDLDVTIIPAPDGGMSASLKTGIHALPDCEYFMLILADMPAITTGDMQTIMAAKSDGTMIVRGATDDGKPGHPILINAALRSEFDRLAGDQGGNEILKAYRNQTTHVPLNGNRARLDIDTPEDLIAWRLS